MEARIRSTLAAAVLLSVVALALPSASQAAPLRCPGTFQVLHDDHIGGMSLPAGPYVITVLESSRLSCDQASDLFRQFLEDYDGRLPRPWVANNTTRTFTRGSGSTTGSASSARPAAVAEGAAGIRPPASPVRASSTCFTTTASAASGCRGASTGSRCCRTGG